MITLIVACTKKDQGIGFQNKLPWHLPDEMKVFIHYTRNQNIIMGRSTFESLGSKPLPNRFNVVATSTPHKFIPDDDLVFTSITDNTWLELARSSVEWFVIGGEDLYRQALPYATKVVMSVVDIDVECDTFFPDINSIAPSKLYPVGPWAVVNNAHHGENWSTNVYIRDYLGEKQFTFAV